MKYGIYDVHRLILPATNTFSGALVTNIRHTPAHWEKHTVEDNPTASTDMAESGAQANRGNITSHQNFNERRAHFSIQKRSNNFEELHVTGPPPPVQSPRRNRPNHDEYPRTYSRSRVAVSRHPVIDAMFRNYPDQKPFYLTGNILRC